MVWLLMDLDGTLVDTGGDITAVTNHVRGRMGLPPLTREEVLPHVGAGAAELIRRLHPDLDEDELPEVLALWQSYYREHPSDHARPYPGIEALLAALPAERLALVTNKPEGIARQLLRNLGLEERFGAILGGAPPRPLKPDPAPFREALERLAGRPEGSAMLGDGKADMRGARAAGLAALGACWGFFPRSALSAWGADRLAGRREQVLDWWTEACETGRWPVRSGGTA